MVSFASSKSADGSGTQLQYTCINVRCLLVEKYNAWIRALLTMENSSSGSGLRSYELEIGTKVFLWIIEANVA